MVTRTSRVYESPVLTSHLRRFAPPLLIALSLGLSACASVPVWRRGHFANPSMQPSVGGELGSRYDAKLTESKTAGGTSGAAPAGGCGCSR